MHPSVFFLAVFNICSDLNIAEPLLVICTRSEWGGGDHAVQACSHPEAFRLLAFQRHTCELRRTQHISSKWLFSLLGLHGLHALPHAYTCLVLPLWQRLPRWMLCCAEHTFRLPHHHGSALILGLKWSPAPVAIRPSLLHHLGSASQALRGKPKTALATTASSLLTTARSSQHATTTYAFATFISALILLSTSMGMKCTCCWSRVRAEFHLRLVLCSWVLIVIAVAHGFFTVLGLGDESAKGVLDVSPAKAFDATLSGMGQVLSANSVQWWNKQDKPDIEAAKESGQDGSNAGKAAPTRLSSSFVVYTAGRSASFALAAQLNEAYCSATGAWTPQQALQQRKASQEQRRAKHYRKVLRRAVKLGSAPVRHQNVPPASLDALMAAHAAGEVDVRSLPQQQPLA